MALFESTFEPAVPFGGRVLREGASGSDVAVLQAVYDGWAGVLAAAGGPLGSAVPIDGSFGPSTTAAVRALQKHFGLAADGVVGSATYFVMGQGVAGNVTYGGPWYGSRELQVGDRGGDVAVLQNRLNLYRYAAIIGRPADGRFDAATAAAVAAFKKDAEANGDAGLAQNAIVGAGFFDASWLYTGAGGRAVHGGRNGLDVAFLQSLLQRLGLYSGEIDGMYDAPTAAAVTAFQVAHGLHPDGVVGPATYHQFGLQNPTAAPAPLAVVWPHPPVGGAEVVQGRVVVPGVVVNRGE